MPRILIAARLSRSVAVLAILSSFALWAQLPPPPVPRMPLPPPGTEQPKDETPPDDQPVKTFKVGVDVVQLFFNVKDKKGGLISDQTKDNFQLLEDGKPQTIKYFSANSDLPLTLGILIDTSLSQEAVLGAEQEVGGAFLKDVMREKDMAFVMSFDVRADLLQDFTNSNRELRAALNKARINTGGNAAASIPGIGSGPVPTANRMKGTVLYDAVYLASHDELSQQVGRKAMILLTDGEDFGSQLKIRDAIEAAQKADSICYVLLVADRGFYAGSGFGYTGAGEMEKLTKETGGRMIEVGSKIEKLREAFDQISRELRSQYSVGYTPTNPNRDGGFRKVEIRSTNGYKVQARAGYYAPAGERSSN